MLACLGSSSPQLRMMMREAIADAQVHLARMADEACLHTMVGLVAALDAIPLRASALGIVLAGQHMSRVQACSTLAWYLLGRQLLQEFEHELLAESQLSGMMRRGRPEL